MDGPRLSAAPLDPAAPLRGATVVVGVGGGIAAYKACELVRLLDKAGAKVWVTMTRRATKFVSPLTFQALSGRPVFTDLFSLTEEASIGHIQLADRADLVILAPASANLIARLAAGMADDAVTSVVLATKAPVLLAPSMNVNMWSHPLTQRNVQTLAALPHISIVGPGDGFLACRWVGPGRLADPADIVEAAASLRTPQDLRGRRLVVSAGPTQEALDPARYLGNRSSGKMGLALALAARRRGAQVSLVLGPTAQVPPPGVEVVNVTTALQMQAALAERVPGADAVIMAAAVADFRPRQVAPQKLKRSRLGGELTLELVSNPDLLAELGHARGDERRPLLVGFAAETEDVVRNAQEKLAKKRCDLVVGNDVSAPGIGFGADDNAVVIVGDGGVVATIAGSKLVVAHGILDQVVARLG
ncbi:MAG: bifunctional phosphopantothenoylcysteine decarboxylase/phosphopantothenate--cysteine ligase CoaBC [Myxococcales bacterium]|nr:bifunctional phosphopantothenoylcysteine decarboxylase/phosphopantothenate--cysteine ligase CoaBC [Myxococcales bacterium]HRC59005.1 bifunctional phosphopantothenoylcysteine decarboxylase/phosphopantothenate--cysteine ligase CoaBC [Kofleriaceae bacterium]